MGQRTGICAQCSTTFTSIRSDARFCSQRCSYQHRLGRAHKRTCGECGVDISDRHFNAKFCPDCYQARENRLSRERLPRHTHCKHCGAEFPEPTNKQFCTMQCAGKHNRTKQLEPRTRQCAACGGEFTCVDARKRTCSTACYQWAAKHPGEMRPAARHCLTCQSLFETTRSHQKYCGDDCRPAHRPTGRSDTLPLKLRQRAAKCGYCSAEFFTAQSRRKYCSERCGARALAAKYAFDEYERRFKRPCKRCGEQIPPEGRIDRQFCCESCQVCFNQEMRRVRKRGLPVEKISRYEIFERDNYTCHICLKPIEDKPVLDHLIPLAVEGCPGHVKANVAAAHAFCNSSKNARVRPADYRLYVELSLGGSVSA